MLFPINSQTPQCAVFELLNNELLQFLRNSIEARYFSQVLFSTYMHSGTLCASVCWTNAPTRKEFKRLWSSLPNTAVERQRLFDDVRRAQNISAFFQDATMDLPKLEPEALFDAFKELTTHLFVRTKDFAAAKIQSNSSIESHYQAFVNTNEGSHLCFICGTAALSQNRVGLTDDDQWRSDYDHLLCKDKYPLFSVHPGNFLPTCPICNSKAKGARNLLRHVNGDRRAAFYPLLPLRESCCAYASVTVAGRSADDLIEADWARSFETKVSFDSAPADVLAKIGIWNEVYQVPSRVEEKIMSDFCEHVSADLMRPTSFQDFQSQLTRKAAHLPADYRKTEWRFWWHKLYQNLDVQSQDSLRDIWSMIEWKLRYSDESDMEATFGI